MAPEDETSARAEAAIRGTGHYQVTGIPTVGEIFVSIPENETGNDHRWLLKVSHGFLPVENARDNLFKRQLTRNACQYSPTNSKAVSVLLWHIFACVFTILLQGFSPWSYPKL